MKDLFKPFEDDYRIYRGMLKHYPVEIIPEDKESDQNLGKPHDPLEKPYNEHDELIKLPDPKEVELKKTDFFKIIEERRSRRVYEEKPISLKELSFLLWATQGVKQKIKVKNGETSFRTVPSAGARHPFETYLYVNNVESLEKGLYRYLPFEHSLLKIKTGNFEKEMIEGTYGQTFCGKAPVTFIWSCIPYRTEWRYGYISHKPILLDGGHLCQNLYLACEATGLGTCAVAAYDQKKMDEFLEIDGFDEMTVYISPVGKVKE